MGTRIMFFVLLFIGYEASAQYIPVRRIPLPMVPMAIGSLIRSGTLTWAVSPGQAVAIWREARQTWEVCAHLSTSNYVVASAAGERSGLYILRSTRDVEFIDSLGRVNAVGSVDRLRSYHTIVSLPGNMLLEANSSGNATQIYSSIFVDGERKPLDTIPANAPQSVLLSYVVPCSTAVMTVVDRLSDGKLDTASYTYDGNDGTWDRMTNAFGSAEHVVVANGDILSLSDGTVVRRRSCDDVEARSGLDRAVDRLVGLADGTVLAYVQRIADTTAPTIYVSTDGGTTFGTHPAFDGIDGYVHGVVECADGVLLAAIGDTLWRIADDAAIVITPPSVETNSSFPDIIPVLHDVSRFFALHTQCCMRETAFYDLDTERWYDVVFTNGKRCTPQYVYPFSLFTVVNDGGTTGILRGTDTVATVIKDADGRALIGAALQAMQLAPDTVLLFVNKVWHIVDITTATGIAIANDWPRAAEGYVTGSVGNVVLGSQPRRIVTGTTEAWNIGPDSLTTVVDRYGILVSMDDGRSWKMSNDGIGTDIYCWAMLNRGDTIYALMSYALHPTTYTQAKMYRSENQGRTWHLASLLPVEIRNRMRMSIARDGTLYVGGLGLVRSSDGGTTWNVITGSWDEDEKPTHAVVHNDHLIVSTGAGLYVSVDPIVSVEDEHRLGGDGRAAAFWDGQAFMVRQPGASDAERIAVYDLTGRAIDVVRTAQGRFTPAVPLPAGPYVVVGRTTTLVLVSGR